MCEFISWVEYKGEVLFLNNKRMREKENKMKVKFPDKSERVGHGAIRWYFGIDDSGTQKECVDFSTPDNFPKEIVRAIKTGQMTYGKMPRGLLNNRLFDRYDIKKKTARKVYDDATATARKVYDDATATARKVYDDATATARKVYDDATATAWKVYDDATAPAQKVYDDATATARKVYDDATATARKVYDDATATARKVYFDAIATLNAKQWTLFKNPKNRTKNWR